jgi:hypothetical protein
VKSVHNAIFLSVKHRKKTVNTQGTLDKTFHPARDSFAASSLEEVTVHSDGEEYTLCDRSSDLDAYVTARRHQLSINNKKDTKNADGIRRYHLRKPWRIYGTTFVAKVQKSTHVRPTN